MKDKKLNIDLSSLYQEPLKGGLDKLDNNTELYKWLEEFRTEQQILTEYMNSCSLENFIYLFVLAFAHKYPNFVNLQSTFQNVPLEDTSEERIYNSGFDRNDIEELNVHKFIGQIEDEFDPGNRVVYEQKVGITFKNEIPEQAIKNALNNYDFIRNKEGDQIIYTGTDNSISKLILNEKNLEIEINEDKVYLYYVS